MFVHPQDTAPACKIRRQGKHRRWTPSIFARKHDDAKRVVISEAEICSRQRRHHDIGTAAVGVTMLTLVSVAMMIGGALQFNPLPYQLSLG
jgi:hypothetical protein